MESDTPSNSDFKFVEPIRAIKSPMDMGTWLKSEAYHDLLGLIMTISESVKGKTSTEECHVSEVTEKLFLMLQTLEDWIEEIPPLDQPQRFGNKAYRDWYKKMIDNSEGLILPVLTNKYKEAIVEFKEYLHGSFGNSTRIDYGTGHEICFLFFLLCLYKLKLFTQQDNIAIVNKIFPKYLCLMRKLQMTYRMEPAGSQGVWGLDDFQFVPYIWGSSQLNDHREIIPEHIPLKEKAEIYYNDYLFFDCVKFIHKVKTGQFGEHSNVLWGISAVKLWSKVNTGLLKMYKAEVLSKFPVIQHLLFGTLVCINKSS